jgi:hypothetical protein
MSNILLETVCRMKWDGRNTTCGNEANVEGRPDMQKGSRNKERCVQLWAHMKNTFISRAGFEVLTAVVMKICLLGYNAVCSAENQPTFRRNISPPTSGSKNTSRKKPA